MRITLVLAVLIFAASLYLVISKPKNPFAIGLLVASGIDLLLATGIIHLAVRGISTREVLAAIFAVLGGILYFRSSSKYQVTAATCVTLFGAIGLLTAIHILR